MGLKKGWIEINIFKLRLKELLGGRSGRCSLMDLSLRISISWGVGGYELKITNIPLLVLLNSK